MITVVGKQYKGRHSCLARHLGLLDSADAGEEGVEDVVVQFHFRRLHSLDPCSSPLQFCSQHIPVLRGKAG